MERIPKVGETWVFKYDHNHSAIVKEVTKKSVTYDKQYRCMDWISYVNDLTRTVPDFIHWYKLEEVENF